MPWKVKDYADGWISYNTEAEARASEEAKNGASITWDGCPFCFVTDPEVMAMCARCDEREAVQAQIAALAARVAKLEAALTPVVYGPNPHRGPATKEAKLGIMEGTGYPSRPPVFVKPDDVPGV